ncbi:DNA-binding protein [Halomonas garicola]|uniref:DNA-binding protein n=1 Tax=Halomonas garicola TaxID=1690008 RepID=UPI00289724A5|nr:DNA-binding protein [Halomonas garicola]
MARTGIQYADVRRAIDELIARGDNPSVQRIREVLGTGSFTTISEHFRYWRDEREKNRDAPPPREIPEAVVTLATDMWRQAQDVANEGLAHYREEANREVEAARDEAQKARQEADNAAQRESALAEHLRHREAHIEGLGTQLAESRAQQKQLQSRSDSAEQACRALREESAEQEAKLEQQARAHSDEARQQREAFDRQLAEEQQRNEATEGKLLALLDGVRQERADDDKAHQKRVRQLEVRLEKAGEENDRVGRELKAVREAETQWQHSHGQLEEALQGQQQAAEEAHRERERLQERLNQAERALEQERERYRHECDWQASLSQRLQALQEQVATLPAVVPDESDAKKR